MLKYPRISSSLTVSPRRVRVHLVQGPVITARFFANRSAKANRGVDSVIIDPKPKSIVPELPKHEPSTPKTTQRKPLRERLHNKIEERAQQESNPVPIHHSEEAPPQKPAPIILNPRPRSTKPPVALSGKGGSKRPLKSSPFIIDSLGFQWDLGKGTVSFTEAERMRCLRTIEECTESLGNPEGCHIQRMQEVVGALLRASYIVVQGRERLGPLRKGVLRARRTNEKLAQSLREKLQGQLKWWADKLKKKCNPIRVETLLVSREVYIDACTARGVEITVEGKREVVRWSRKVERDGKAGVASAVETVVRHLVKMHGVKGTRLRITCNDEAVVNSWTKDRSPNLQVNGIILSMLNVLVRSGCYLTLEMMPSYGRPVDVMPRSKAAETPGCAGPEPTKSPQPIHIHEGNVLSNTRKSSATVEPKSTPKPSPRKARAGPSFTLFKVIMKSQAWEPPLVFSQMGFEWNLLGGMVSLTKKERQRCLQVIESGLSTIERLKDDGVQLQILVTKLLHASHVVIEGRKHLEPLIMSLLRCRGGREEIPSSKYPKERIREDLVWWLELLQRRGDTTRISTLTGGMVDTGLYTDASLNYGCAIVMADRVIPWEWKPGVTLDNNWAEAAVVEIAVRLAIAESGGKGAHFKITSDNMAIINGWTMGRSWNPQVNGVILSMANVLVKSGCWLSLDWVASEKNPADTPSRGKNAIGLRNTKWDPVIIPAETRQYLRDVSA